jgi:hypothetical protein
MRRASRLDHRGTESQSGRETSHLRVGALSRGWCLNSWKGEHCRQDSEEHAETATPAADCGRLFVEANTSDTRWCCWGTSREAVLVKPTPQHTPAMVVWATIPVALQCRSRNQLDTTKSDRAELAIAHHKKAMVFAFSASPCLCVSVVKTRSYRAAMSASPCRMGAHPTLVRAPTCRTHPLSNAMLCGIFAFLASLRFHCSSPVQPPIPSAKERQNPLPLL